MKQRRRATKRTVSLGQERRPVQHIADEVPVTVSITGEDPGQILECMQNVRETAGYDVRFFPVLHNSAGYDERRWFGSLSESDILNAACVHDRDVRITQAMNVPIYWRDVRTPFLYLEPSCRFREKGWLLNWVRVCQLNLDLAMVGAYPSAMHRPFHVPKEEAFGADYPVSTPALFVRPDIVDVLGMFFDVYEDPRECVRDYVRRALQLGRRVWQDYAVHLEHEGIGWNRQAGKVELLRNAGIDNGVLSWRHQHNGLELGTQYSLMRAKEGVPWSA